MARPKSVGWSRGSCCPAVSDGSPSWLGCAVNHGSCPAQRPIHRTFGRPFGCWIRAMLGVYWRHGASRLLRAGGGGDRRASPSTRRNISSGAVIVMGSSSMVVSDDSTLSHRYIELRILNPDYTKGINVDRYTVMTGGTGRARLLSTRRHTVPYLIHSYMHVCPRVTSHQANIALKELASGQSTQ